VYDRQYPNSCKLAGSKLCGNVREKKELVGGDSLGDKIADYVKQEIIFSDFSIL
jgi:hypothetical protein